ncbi:hypothetical protein QTP88_028630 [Uroleucon formosanum]
MNSQDEINILQYLTQYQQGVHNLSTASFVRENLSIIFSSYNCYVSFIINIILLVPNINNNKIPNLLFPNLFLRLKKIQYFPKLVGLTHVCYIRLNYNFTNMDIFLVLQLIYDFVLLISLKNMFLPTYFCSVRGKIRKKYCFFKLALCTNNFSITIIALFNVLYLYYKFLFYSNSYSMSVIHFIVGFKNVFTKVFKRLSSLRNCVLARCTFKVKEKHNNVVMMVVLVYGCGGYSRLRGTVMVMVVHGHGPVLMMVCSLVAHCGGCGCRALDAVGGDESSGWFNRYYYLQRQASHMILTSLNPEIEPIYRANAITGSAVSIAKGFALKLLSLATFELQNLRYNIFPTYRRSNNGPVARFGNQEVTNEFVVSTVQSVSVNVCINTYLKDTMLQPYLSTI